MLIGPSQWSELTLLGFYDLVTPSNELTRHQLPLFTLKISTDKLVLKLSAKYDMIARWGEMMDQIPYY